MGKLLDKVVHEAQLKGRRVRTPETREAGAPRTKSPAVACFLATFQICVRSEPLVAGPAYKSRTPEQTVLVLAEKPEEVGKVIAENVALESNQTVEVTQLRQLEGGRKVFTARPQKKGA